MVRLKNELPADKSNAGEQWVSQPLWLAAKMYARPNWAVNNRASAPPSAARSSSVSFITVSKNTGECASI